MDTDSDALTKDGFKKMSVSEFLALDNDKLKKFLRANGFQEKYKAEKLIYSSW